MNSRDFCYWLQGFVDMAKPETLSREQMDVVKRHLAMALASETELSFPARETTLAIFSQHAEDDLPASVDDPAALTSASPVASDAISGGEDGAPQRAWWARPFRCKVGLHPTPPYRPGLTKGVTIADGTNQMFSDPCELCGAEVTYFSRGGWR